MGFYDRYIERMRARPDSANPCYTIGIGLNEQREEEIPSEDHDQLLDAVIFPDAEAHDRLLDSVPSPEADAAIAEQDEEERVSSDA